MIFHKSPLILFTFILISALGSLSAQNKKLIAEVRLIDKQKQLADSAFLKGAPIFDEDEYPAFDNYSDEWSASIVDPYKVKLSQFPDSFVVDCSEYYPPVESKITSHFGPRWGRLHCGTDLALHVGDSVRAAFSGKIRITKMNPGGYGYYVVIRHPNGLETLYGHLSKFLVDIGDEVEAGDVIGLGGNTGRSTGPHLHFEARLLGRPINPAQMFDFENHVPYNDYFTVYRDKTFKDNIVTKSVNRSTVKRQYYTVKSGDTLQKIAKKQGVSEKKLRELNHLSAKSTLKKGKRIRIS